ncbi:peptidase S8 [Streptomyces sp. GXMU-J5]|uniref:Peptidase S8 n=2 Tax=Streptomyces beihaiensis TaxID=2984495 RepID=A0ABT3U495_9ACTN|nr:peptidase S8 [Streptomyces beihaiensis]MCX3063466.1 peptidase S8 [Streptomyces beihaiensis]
MAAAALAFTAPGSQAAPATLSTAHGVTTAHACATPTKKDVMACGALQVTAGTPKSAHAESDLTAAAAPSGYGPASLQAAYNLPSATGGSGQTVAIVDAYDDPNAEADLATYRSQYGLPACTTANGCFSKYDQNGGTHYPRGDSGWAEEISLDLDMVSAACPNCHIMLVEAKTASMTNLGTAVNTAVSKGAKFVSNSYGGGESSSDSSYDQTYFNHPGVAITVSSGDNGYGVEYPAASKYVTAVGGTSLKSSSNSRGWTDSVWSGAGSGCSADDAKPSWQTDSGCSNRTVADVSAVADPNTGVAVYDTYRQATGWMVFGGTSASSPLIAAVYALAGSPSSGSYPASFPYAHTSSLYDVTSGSNGSCGGSYLCTAGSGYDGPSGLGVPNGTAAFTG